MIPLHHGLTRRLGVGLACLLLLAGCSSGGGSAGSQAPVAASRAAAAPHSYTVQRGDTIYGIARQFNLSVRTLIDANRLQPPFQVQPGQVLTLGGGGDYVVARGDTLNGVARKTGTTPSTLARLNNLSAPYILQIGQKLTLPGGASSTSTDDGTTVISSSRAAPVPAPIATPQPVQQQAVTAAAAAVAAAPAPASTPTPTPAASSQPVPSGQKGGYAPLSGRQAQAAPAPAPAGGRAVAEPAVDQGSTPVAEPATAAQPAEIQTASAVTAPLPAVPAPSGRAYLWPVKGQVIGEFGSTGRGQHNDGINIQVAKGTPVVAAEDGVVAYAGNELKGFGNMLLIKHADGWMTAYAHNDQLLVKRGTVVKRGEQVALSGDSGGVAVPQLHFEVRRGTRAVDPLSVLGGKSSPAVSPSDRPGPG